MSLQHTYTEVGGVLPFTYKTLTQISENTYIYKNRLWKQGKCKYSRNVNIDAGRNKRNE